MARPRVAWPGRISRDPGGPAPVGEARDWGGSAGAPGMDEALTARNQTGPSWCEITYNLYTHTHTYTQTHTRYLLAALRLLLLKDPVLSLIAHNQGITAKRYGFQTHYMCLIPI